MANSNGERQSMGWDQVPSHGIVWCISIGGNEEEGKRCVQNASIGGEGRPDSHVISCIGSQQKRLHPAFSTPFSTAQSSPQPMASCYTQSAFPCPTTLVSLPSTVVLAIFVAPVSRLPRTPCMRSPRYALRKLRFQPLSFPGDFPRVTLPPVTHPSE